MSTLQAIGIIVGVVSGLSGVVLGIVNYWERRVSTRPRIVVRVYIMPGCFSSKSTKDERYPGLVEVCNVGQVPVMMVGDIGFLPTKRGHTLPVTISPKPYNDVTTWPGELKPQHAAMLEFDFRLSDLLEGRKVRRVYVESAIGDRFKASRGEMRWVAKQLEAAST